MRAARSRGTTQRALGELRIARACVRDPRSSGNHTRTAGARAAGIRRWSLRLREVQLGQGVAAVDEEARRQPVGRRNRGDQRGAGGTPVAGITRATRERTVEEVRRARQGGGQWESLNHGKPQGGLGRPAQRLR
jgi:hypothetical protein